MRPPRLALALTLAAALPLAGCGSGGGTIARTDAASLQAGLDGVASAVSGGRCNAAAAAVENVRSKVRNLQGTIPGKLQRNLEQGVSQLASATPGDCADVVRQQQAQTTTDTITTETTTTTDTTTTDTTTTDTTTTGTDTTTTPATTTTPTGGVSPETTTTTTTTTVPPAGDGSGGASGGGAQGAQQ